MTEHLAIIGLNRVPNVGAVTARRLIDAFGAASAVYSASTTELAAVKGLSAASAATLYRALQEVDPAAEEARALALNTRILTWDEPDYPQRLLTISAPPLALYVTGDWRVLAQPSIAIIGTRRASTYGQLVTKQFATQIADAGVHVVSGLAEGIDTEAHRGALLSHSAGRTIAVIASGLDEIYPQSNKPLAREIVRSGGAVVTEYPFGRRADRQTFPMRNRIVSGLACGVLVAECPRMSGTRITVQFAQEQGRPVFVIPGRIDTPGAKGCHELIRQGATLVDHFSQVLDDCVQELDLREEVAPYREQNTAEMEALPIGLSVIERQILEAIPAEGARLDELVEKSGLPPGKLMSQLVSMELARRVRCCPGGLYMRVKS